MDIARLCTREVVTIDAGASLRAAATLMCEQHVGALVVVERTDPPRVAGVITDRDLALETLGRDALAVALTAGHLVKTPPVAVRAGADLREALAAMEEGGVRRLLVVDDQGSVTGLVSADDVVGAIAAELEGLARALRSSIARETRERAIATGTPVRRPVFPAFGSVAMQ